MSDVSPTHRPTRMASVLAVGAAAGAMAAIADLPAQRVAIGLSVGAVLGLAIGDAFVRRDEPVVGWGLVGGATLLGFGALGVALTFTTGYTPRAELLPGLIGIVLLGAGVLGPHRQLSRRLVSAGFVFVLLGVTLSGLVRGAAAPNLLAGAAAAVVAWDAGEHAISLGEQLGREARTWPVEVLHVASTALMGASAAAGALVLSGILGTRRVPLGGLVAMLAAALALLVVLSLRGRTTGEASTPASGPSRLEQR